MRDLPSGQRDFDFVPNRLWHGIQIGIAHLAFQLGDDTLGSSSFHPVDTDVTKEPQLVLSTEDVQMPAVAVARFSDSLDATEHSHPRKKIDDIIDEAPTRRRIVNP